MRIENWKRKRIKKKKKYLESARAPLHSSTLFVEQDRDRAAKDGMSVASDYITVVDCVFTSFIIIRY